MVLVASQRRRIRGAGVLRLAALLLALGGCFADPGRYGSASDTGASSTGDGEATTAAQTPTSGALTTSGAELSTGPGETGEPGSTSTGDPTADVTTDITAGPTTSPTTSPTDPTGRTTNPATTDPAPAVCGDGIVEGAEACDHGPENGGPSCNLDCTAPTCSDGVQDQDESDIDCGGSCQTCGLCKVCTADADCNGSCVGGRCSRTDVLDVSYLENCGDTVDFWVTGPELPGGSYLVIAEGGGGSVTGTDTEYGWLAECVGFNLEPMSAPFVYPSPQEAYAALPVNQLQLDFAGGSLRCGLTDLNCDDNLAGVSISFTLQCPP